MNRLGKETSPYLLQHAHNPVDWFPWGEEALANAKAANKPILVSIGYSACHWCHVMERECFEQENVAVVMNEHFVNIKIDREERPDLDAIYMDAVQAMGVQGGWPLNVFLMPDGKPFYGGTYFAQRNWLELLKAVNNGFVNHKDELQQSAEGFTENMVSNESAKYSLLSEPQVFTGEDLTTMYQKLAGTVDLEWGGFQRSPKFPMPSVWLFLLRYVQYLKATNASVLQVEEAEKSLKITLDFIAAGGIYDQLGGGFARYSVDGEWFCPHFEKMLYDNGQLLSLYSEAYCLTKSEVYKETVSETIDWLKREMLSPEGGFYSALDADSEGVEGKYYVWTYAEIQQILGEKTAAFCDAYQVTMKGNWEHGVNILWKNGNQLGLNSQFKEEIALLSEERGTRVRPGLDDKILCSWNGLLLKGLVDAYRVFGENTFLELALQNAHFIQKNLLEDAILWHSYKNGEAKIMGFLEDYAAVIDAYTHLYQVTFDEQWLHLAEKMTLYVWQNFWDDNDELFFFTDEKAEKLIARKKEIFDNVIPSSNSMMAKNFYTLGMLLERTDFIEVATLMVSKMKKLLLSNVEYLTNWACLASQLVRPTAEIAIIGENAEELRKELETYYLPNKVVTGTATMSELPLLEGRMQTKGETRIFVCYHKTCQLPVSTVVEALVLIKA